MFFMGVWLGSKHGVRRSANRLSAKTVASSEFVGRLIQQRPEPFELTARVTALDDSVRRPPRLAESPEEG
jgi:hypothetical protein